MSHPTELESSTKEVDRDGAALNSTVSRNDGPTEGKPSTDEVESPVTELDSTIPSNHERKPAAEVGGDTFFDLSGTIEEVQVSRAWFLY